MADAPPTIVWLRHCLRTNDNAALAAACQRPGAVLPVFVWDPGGEGDWPAGAATRWWLHHALLAFKQELDRLGLPLIIRKGSSESILSQLIAETGANACYWDRRYEPAVIVRDGQLQEKLQASHVSARSFNTSLLFEPWEIATKEGKPFQVFTPFWKACLAGREPSNPVSPPVPMSAESPALESLSVEDLRLLPTIGWDAGLERCWQPGSAGAHARLEEFLATGIGDYHHQRNRPGVPATSRLSPHLHFGEIGPREIWAAVSAIRQTSSARRHAADIQAFLTELGWREFSYHVLTHFPQAPTEPLKSRFQNFPWEDNGQWLTRWQRGQTGYPLVDAGMRELWTTGWMHNRVRMVVASFLTKDLLIPWQRGAEWFWETLVDADLASNTMGWQWTAGCGVDAAPYFRVFNPVLQSEKFDPQGDYLRKWVPELARLPHTWLHKPWAAPAGVLQQAGVVLGRTYPEPIVDHQDARKRALAIHSQLSN